MKKTYYLIDTENIGDRWLHLITTISKDDTLIVFYSENHSKLLEETYLKQRYNTRIKWVECVTGPDALDYQLAGVLSYLITQAPDASYVICSNDKDYRNETGFWLERGIDVSRRGFTDANLPCTKPRASNPIPETLKDYIVNLPDSLICTDNLAALTSEHIDEILTELSRAIPLSELYCWNVTLTALFGQSQSGRIYARVKEDEALRAELSKNLFNSSHDRQVYLLAIMMKSNGLNPENAFAAHRIICKRGTKNISAIKADFMKQFGKKQRQLQYFFCLRPILPSFNNLLNPVPASTKISQPAAAQTPTQPSQAPVPVKPQPQIPKNKPKVLKLFNLFRRNKKTDQSLPQRKEPS